MRLAILSLIFSLTACQTLPPKPVLTLCVIDYPRLEGICGETSGDKINTARDLTYNNIVASIYLSPTVRRVPLSSMDKSVSAAPPEWEKLQNYVHALEYAVQNRCQ